jgi:ElaB/YqjD/DUF883 family membrane-anchored ribosome-binding protein
MSILKDLAEKAEAAAEQLKKTALDVVERASETKDAVVEGTKNAVDAALGHKEKK